MQVILTTLMLLGFAVANNEAEFLIQVDQIPAGLYFSRRAENDDVNGAVYAVNNLLGGILRTPSDFQMAAEIAHEKENREIWAGTMSDIDSPYKAMIKSHHYDPSVIPFVLQGLRVEFITSPNDFQKKKIPGLRGFLVNFGTHWFAIRSFQGNLYKIDSTDGVRQFKSKITLADYLKTHLEVKHHILAIGGENSQLERLRAPGPIDLLDDGPTTDTQGDLMSFTDVVQQIMPPQQPNQRFRHAAQQVITQQQPQAPLQPQQQPQYPSGISGPPPLPYSPYRRYFPTRPPSI